MQQVVSITGELTSAYTMTASDTTYILEKGASITTTSPNALFYQNDELTNTHVVVKGQITGGSADTDYGVTSSISGSDVKITGSGSVEAGIGIALVWGDQQILNHGTIDGSHFGVWLRSVEQVVTNFGHISGGADGIITGGLGGASVVNEAGGRITSQGDAIQFNGSTDTTSTLTNDGLIKGAWAFSSGWGAETVINHGQMKGLIYMGEGDDTFDNRGGKVDQDIYGQQGYDTLITDDANVHLREDADQGTDTVKSTVTYALNVNVENLILLGKADNDGTGTGDSNEITGNRGDNKLLGLGGIDILNGGRGNDILKGGAGGDTFMFAQRGGHDTISDFKSGVDHINLVGQTAIGDFDDMINNHVTSSSHGQLTIHMGPDTLTLQNTDVGDLDASDFVF